MGHWASGFCEGVCSCWGLLHLVYVGKLSFCPFSAPISHPSMGYHIFYKDIMGGVLSCTLGGIAVGLGFYFSHFSVTPCYTILVLGNFSKEGERG